MMKPIFLFLIVVTHLYADNGLPLSNTDGSLPTIVDHSVSVITGDFMESSCDLILQGPEPLLFERFYSSGDHQGKSLYAGFRHNHESHISTFTKQDSNNLDAVYTNINGRQAKYFGPMALGEANSSTLKYQEHLGKGYTNCGSNTLSGRSHIKNSSLTNFAYSRHLKANGENGAEFHFDLYQTLNNERKFRLVKAVTASKNCFQYRYGEEVELKTISSFDRKGTYLFGELHLKYLSSKSLKNNPVFQVEASDGRKVVYKLKKFQESGMTPLQEHRISEVIPPNGPRQRYEYRQNSSKIAKKTLPNGRFLAIKYFDWNKNKTFLAGKVHQLFKPLGTDGSPILAYSFAYDRLTDRSGNLTLGFTYVWNARNDLTSYIYDHNLRLRHIEKYIGGGKEYLYSTENFYWSDEGNLLCHSIEDQHHQISAARVFSYDARGNVLTDSFYGNLQGGTVNIEFDERQQRPHQKGCNSWTISYRYSEDGRNLILEENYPNGKSIQYEYENERDLMVSKFTLGHGVILKREFFEYDAFGLCVCKIVDDATDRHKNHWTNVTMRRITRIENQFNVPVGLPKVISEYYFDFERGQETLLKRVKNSYCTFGNLVCQEVYDANDRLVASHHFEYDAHGNVIVEEDTLKNRTIKTYNENDELISQNAPHKNELHHFTHDFMGRMIVQESHLKDGVNLVISNSYDYMGNKVVSVDAYGHKTDYLYDSFGRIIQINDPDYIDPLGKRHQRVIKKEYDIFGNVRKVVDALGSETITDYNARGKPIRISYGDGREERFEYEDAGTLRKSVGINGLTTLFTYDIFGRVMREETYSKEGAFLSCKNSRYNSFHKLEEEDENGEKTVYSYTFFGELKRVVKGDSCKEFEYDASQRVLKEKTWVSGTSFQAKVYTYDIFNRVMEEKIEDENGLVLNLVGYKYDVSGNKIEEIREGKAGTSSLKTEYGADHLPIRVTSPEGHTTHFTYDRHFTNRHGEPVLRVIEENSLGIQTITEMNVFGKPDTILKKNPLGQLLSKKEIGYDAAQNIVFTKEAVLGGLEERPDILTKYFYNKENSLILLIEAFGTKEQKTTEFQYNVYNQESAIIKPDGRRIEKTYDAWQRLASIKASDGSFSYLFSYDAVGNLIKSEDLVNETEVVRNYDALGHLLSENFGHGIVVKYSYDRIGRPLSTELPDGSSVSYTYDALYLRKGTRRLKSGEVVFSHEYLSYDLSGNLLEEKNSSGFGACLYQYDLTGHLKIAENPLFTETISYDALGNVTGIKSDDEEKTFSYDALNQLEKENGPFNHAYKHDSLYNCVVKDGNAQKTNSLNQLLETNEKKYSYDANGNRLFDGKKMYRYDPLDRLTAVSFEDEVYLYTYDSFNRRLSKKYVKEGKTVDEELYLYFGQNEVGAFDAQGSLKEFRMLGTGKGAEIGATLLIELEGACFFPLHDYHGNIVALIDCQTIETKERYQYSAFGKEKILNENEEIINPWRFSSKRVDKETGFSNFGRRYYDPETATWLSPDPIGFEGGPNLYAYVMNNPLSLYDLYGLEAVARNQRWTSRFAHSVREAVNYCVKTVQDVIQRTVTFAKDLFKSGPEKVYYNRTLEESYKEQSRNIVIASYNESAIPGIELGLTNGMLNEEVDARGNGGIVGECAENVNVNLTYSQTRSAWIDAMVAAKGVCGNVSTKASKKIYKRWMKFFKENPDGHYLEVGHSRGVIDIRLALLVCPKEIRDHIHILAIAPGTFISRELCGSVHHYVSSRDFVPLFNLRGRIACRDNVTVLTPHKDAPFFDHSFSSPTYREVIKEEIGDFIDKYRK